MQLKILDLNDPKENYKFNLSAIGKRTWECFVYDVVLSECESIDNVVQVASSITIRDNLAKMMIAYQDKKYNELSFTLSPEKTFSGKHGHELTNAWQSVMASVYGKEYLDDVQNQDVLNQD